MALSTTIEQLRSKSWPTRAAAARELKRKGFAERGADYELREASSGSWQLCSLEEDPAPLPEPQGSELFPAPEWLAPELAPSDALTVSDATPETPEPAEPTKPPGTDLAPLPAASAGHYSLHIDAAHLRQNSIVLQALEISRKIGFPVEILGPTGVGLRTVDAAAIRAQPKVRNATSPRPGASALSLGFQTKAIELAQRPEGVTREQLRDLVTDRGMAWTTILKGAERLGYVYSTTTAPPESKSRTVYHLKKP